MKKITAFFILVILISFVSCDTVTYYTMRVSVDRDPIGDIAIYGDVRLYIAGSYKECTAYAELAVFKASI